MKSLTRSLSLAALFGTLTLVAADAQAGRSHGGHHGHHHHHHHLRHHVRHHLHHLYRHHVQRHVHRTYVPVVTPPPPVYVLGVWTTPVEIQPAPSPLAVVTTAPGPAAQVLPAQGPPTYGLRIDAFTAHSAADHDGLEPGDVLLIANGRPLQCKADLRLAVRTSQGRLELLVLRARTGATVTMVVHPQLRHPATVQP